DAEGRELVGHHAQQPARRVRLAPARSERPDLLGRAMLLPRAEHAGPALALARGRREVGGAARALGGDDDPAADDGIPAQLRHATRLPLPASARAPGARPATR